MKYYISITKEYIHHSLYVKIKIHISCFKYRCWC